MHTYFLFGTSEYSRSLESYMQIHYKYWTRTPMVTRIRAIDRQMVSRWFPINNPSNVPHTFFTKLYFLCVPMRTKFWNNRELVYTKIQSLKKAHLWLELLIVTVLDYQVKKATCNVIMIIASLLRLSYKN